MDYSTLLSDATKALANDSEVRSAYTNILSAMRSGSVTYADQTRFATALGNASGRILSQYSVAPEDLENFANKLLAPLYRDIQNTSIKAGNAVQKVRNEQMGIKMNPVEVKPNTSRVNNIVKRFEGAEDYKDVEFLSGKDVASNIAQSAINDVMQKNAEAQSEAGYDMYVIRSSGGGCCSWCDSMCGRYNIGEEPDDFWMVHKDCTCEFEYKRGSTHTRIRYITQGGNRMKSTEDI